MKNKSVLIISIVIFIGVFALCAVGYNYLSKVYEEEQQNKISQSQNLTETEKVKEKAPDFTVTDYSGNKVNLSDFKGKPVVINFWATWCGPCKSELPHFDKLYSEKNQEIEFMMVNLTDGQSETEDTVKSFINETGYKFPVYFDTEYSGANAYQVYSIPLTVFVDKDGNIIDSYTGAMSFETLNGFIEKLVGE